MLDRIEYRYPARWNAARALLDDAMAPGAMIAPCKYPCAIMVVDALPRTRTGKIRRFELREEEPR